MDKVESKSPLQKFIERERELRGLTHREFAAMAGIDKSQFSRIVNGTNKTDPPLDFLYKLAKATGTDIRYLVSLVYPDAAFEDAHAAMLTQMITKLNRANRETLETFLLGLLEREKLAGEIP